VNAPLAEPGARIVAIIRSYKGAGIARWGRAKGEDPEGVSALNGRSAAREARRGVSISGLQRIGEERRKPESPITGPRCHASRREREWRGSRKRPSGIRGGNGRAGEVTSEWRSVEAAAPHADALSAQTIVAQHDEKAQVLLNLVRTSEVP
jgi:hypothetical protein